MIDKFELQITTDCKGRKKNQGGNSKSNRNKNGKDWKWIFQLAPRQVETFFHQPEGYLQCPYFICKYWPDSISLYARLRTEILLSYYPLRVCFSLPSNTCSKLSAIYCLFFLHSNNNRSGRKITGKKFQPLMSQDMTERSDVTDSSYSCSPSKQGPLRLKLSSGYLLVKFS